MRNADLSNGKGTGSSPGGRSAEPSRRQLFLGVGGCLLLGGCETTSSVFGLAVPHPFLELTLVASPLANPDPFERPSPVVVRTYLLANTDSFAVADFLTLFEADAAALGASMLQRREIILTPGSVQVIRLALKPEVQALGLLVGYRAFDLAAWRLVFPLDGRVATRLRADVNRAGVQLHPLNRD